MPIIQTLRELTISLATGATAEDNLVKILKRCFFFIKKNVLFKKNVIMKFKWYFILFFLFLKVYFFLLSFSLLISLCNVSPEQWCPAAMSLPGGTF